MIQLNKQTTIMLPREQYRDISPGLLVVRIVPWIWSTFQKCTVFFQLFICLRRLTFAVQKWHLLCILMPYCPSISTSWSNKDQIKIWGDRNEVEWRCCGLGWGLPCCESFSSVLFFFVLSLKARMDLLAATALGTQMIRPVSSSIYNPALSFTPS